MTGIRRLLVAVLAPCLAGCPALLGLDGSYTAGSTHDAATGADTGGRDASVHGDSGHDGSSPKDTGAGERDGGGADASDAGPPQCMIAGSGYPSGTANPNNPCQVCSLSDPTAWTNANDGASCGNDQTCAGGACGTLCTIAGTPYPSGTPNPSNGCQLCQPGSSTSMWTNAEGTSCGVDEVCHAGSCISGCFIAGTVYAAGAGNPTNVCQDCVPTTPGAWSSVADGTACTDGGAVSCLMGSCGCPSSSTGISGVVMDPGMNVGLSNVQVYILSPGATLNTIPDEPANSATGVPPSCDTCASLYSPFTIGTTTGADGRFNLTVGAGSYTVIAQIGRWRRVVHNVSVTDCAITGIPSDNIRMPQTQTEGDIPKIALVGGAVEALDCWLLKVGVAASEIAPYSAGATNRVQVYSPDGTGSGAAGLNYWNGTAAVTPPPANALWANGVANTLNDYSALLQACDGSTGPNTESAASQTAVMNYGNSGGKLFIDHFPALRWTDLATGATPSVPGSSWAGSAVATWTTATGSLASAAATMLDSTPDQQAMSGWLAVWGGGPSVTIDNARGSALSIVASVSTQLLAYTAAPQDVGTFWFNTPITATGPPASPYCGRFVFNDMHLPDTRSPSLTGGTTAANTFPAVCSTTALTSQELAMEYELFAMSACDLN